MRRCRIWLSAILAFTWAASAWGAPAYRVEVVGPAGSSGRSIDDAGHVAGYFTNGGIDQAFIYDGSTYKDLGTIVGFTHSRAAAMNNGGQVVGVGVQGSLTVGFVFPDPITGELKMYKLPTPDVLTDLAVANAINDGRTIVGKYFRIENGASAYHAFKDNWQYTVNDFTDINGLLGTAKYSNALGINSRGDVVGEFNETGYWAEEQNRAFLLTATNVFIDIGNLGGTRASATAISDNGLVVGNFNQSSGGTRAFLYDSATGTKTVLGTFGGLVLANSVNDKGEIVGNAEIAPGVINGFVYENGKLVNLNDRLLNGTGWTIKHAFDVNKHGDIAGVGVFNGQEYAVRLTAVPLPSSVIMGMVLLAGIGGLSVYRRKRHAD